VKKQHFKGKSVVQVANPPRLNLEDSFQSQKHKKSLVNCPHSRALIWGSTKILYGNERKKTYTNGKGKRQFKEKNMGIR